MLEVSESKLAQYVMHYVSDTLVLGDEAFSQPEVYARSSLYTISV